jgi:hypothetical protein
VTSFSLSLPVEPKNQNEANREQMSPKMSKSLLFCQTGLKVKKVRTKRPTTEQVQQDSLELSVSLAAEKVVSACRCPLKNPVAATNIAL